MQELKISVCFIQYNRINYLLESLEIISKQSYSNIEIVISDDCSTDDTEEQILSLIPSYKFPINYHRNQTNLGYDRNFRQAIELGCGDYCFILGNDDTIVGETAIEEIVDFITKNNFPDLGFTNYFEYATKDEIVKRASQTEVLGTGIDVALKYYNCFSFVGGLIFKKSTFTKYNTNLHDGSIYAQMYLGCRMIISGAILFSLDKAYVGKDILFDNTQPYSYRDKIAKSWKNFKIVDGGLHSVINVMISVLEGTNNYNQGNGFHVFKRIYSRTFPYWILNYKHNNALPEAIGLFIGLLPHKNVHYHKLNMVNQLKLYFIYLFFGLSALIFPSQLFFKFQHKIYSKLND